MPCNELGKPIDRLQKYLIQKDYYQNVPESIINSINYMLNDIIRYRRYHEKYLEGLQPYAGKYVVGSDN